ncbi:MAG: sugar ABC transporter permease [Clostridiales bacterium]|jgi:ABC-type sugar transport system permease subunit|nr:sugar ABC transporter permease [Clostridiales bacterium]
MSDEVKKRSFMTRKRRRLIFYVSIVALPVLQFCVFYIGVNFNSILLAFRRYDMLQGKYLFYGMENFTRFFLDFKEKQYLGAAVRNSLLMYAVSLSTMVIATFFSYYIYKKKRFSMFFKIMLFFPHIVSSITLVLMFLYFTENAYPELVEKVFGLARPAGLVSDPQTVKGTILFFCMWTGMGTSVLMFSGSMSGINDSVTEAAKLDGCGYIREYWHIVLPMIYPTLVTFIVVGVAGIFTHQMALFSFFGTEAEYALYTFGYFLYRGIKTATVSGYPYLSAAGLVLTFVAVPLTMIVRKLLNRFGPRTE